MALPDWKGYLKFQVAFIVWPAIQVRLPERVSLNINKMRFSQQTKPYLAPKPVMIVFRVLNRISTSSAKEKCLM